MKRIGKEIHTEVIQKVQRIRPIPRCFFFAEAQRQNRADGVGAGAGDRGVGAGATSAAARASPSVTAGGRISKSLLWSENLEDPSWMYKLNSTHWSPVKKYLVIGSWRCSAIVETSTHLIDMIGNLIPSVFIVVVPSTLWPIKLWGWKVLVHLWLPIFDTKTACMALKYSCGVAALGSAEISKRTWRKIGQNGNAMCNNSKLFRKTLLKHHPNWKALPQVLTFTTTPRGTEKTVPSWESGFL